MTRSLAIIFLTAREDALMRVECPNCEVGIHLAEPPEDDTPIKCPKCKSKFVLDDEDDDRPAPKSRAKAGDKASGGKKPGKKKKTEKEEKGFPLIPVIGGGVALLVVAGVAIALMAGGKGDKKKDTATDGTETVSKDTGTPDTPKNTGGTDTAKPDGASPKPAPEKGRAKGSAVAALDPGQKPPGSGQAKKSPEEPTPADGATPARPGTPGTTPTEGTTPKATPGIPSQYAELFAKAVSSPPPTIRAATLEPVDEEVYLDIPTFYSLRTGQKEEADKKKKGPAPKVNPKAGPPGKMTIDELEKACAFIKVDAGDRGGTGSGFLIFYVGNDGLVATNHHVIRAALNPRFGAANATITCVFNSGTASERAYPAGIIAFDPVADLAILRVQKKPEEKWPKVLDPYHTAGKPARDTECRFWGFPLGSYLATDLKKNPQISVGPARVSNFEEDVKTGKLQQIIISGTMNPGNSGGPVVDTDGRLVGIAVAIVNPEIGTGIGYAVPVEDLIALLEGKVWGRMVIFVPDGIEGNTAKFSVFVPVMDPLDKIETVSLRRWAGDGDPPKAEKNTAIGYNPIGLPAKKGGKADPAVEQSEKFQKFSLEGSSLDILVGKITIPADAKKVMFQIASRTKPIVNQYTGAQYQLVASSKPVSYNIKVADVGRGTDTKPLTELTANPAGLVGQTVVVKARIASPPSGYAGVQTVVVVDVDGKRPEKMRFLVDKAAAVQFDEVELEHQRLPVRLVCVVGKPDKEGVVNVRVARCDFIGRGQHIVRTIPNAEDPKDQIFAVNRDPKRYAGRTVEGKSIAVIKITGVTTGKPKFALDVIGPGLMSPRNLNFTLSNRMQEVILEKAKSDGLRIAFPIEGKIVLKLDETPKLTGARTNVAVTRMEITDPSGKTIVVTE